MTAKRSSSAAVPTIRSTFVGRERELEELNLVLGKVVKNRSPKAMLVSGNTGVGKTKLLRHWLENLWAFYPDVRIFTAKAQSDGPAYGVFTELLEQRLHLTDVTDQNRLERLRQEVESVLKERRLTEVLHFLGSFLGVNMPENAFLRAMSDEADQSEQLSRTMLRHFLEMDAQSQPVILVVDNLEEADASSLSLFRELAQSLQGAPLLLLGAASPELLVRSPEFSNFAVAHEQLNLQPLTRPEAETMVRALMPTEAAIPASFVEMTVDKTAGNPFFIEELLHVLCENGTISLDAHGKWQLNEEKLTNTDLPLSVEQVVEARIATLTVAERDVLEKASTLGGTFWLEALICLSRLEQEVVIKADIWMADALQQTIQELLDGLTHRQFLERHPSSVIPGVTEYAFAHAKERELITRQVNPQRHKLYHQFAAQWLETKLVDRTETMLEYLGTHYERGGNNRRAAFCFIHAGDKARARYANEQAIRYYQHGLNLLDLNDAIAKIEALRNLGDVCHILGRGEDALHHYSEMLRFAWLLDDKARGATAHRRLGRVYKSLGEYEKAELHLSHALRLFDRAQDSRGFAATLDNVGQMEWLRGEYDKALEFHRKALEMKRKIGDAGSIAAALHNIGTVYLNSGSFQLATQCFDEALELRRKAKDRAGVVESISLLGSVYRGQSDYAKAFELWTEALTEARLIGDRPHQAELLLNGGEALIQMGKTKEAEDALREALALALALGEKRITAECRRTLCEAKLAVSDLVGAEEEAQAAYDEAVALGLKPELGAASRVLAEVLAAKEIDEARRDKAATLFREAISLFTELGNDLELARTFASYADFNDRLGQWQDADHYRKAADEIFDRLQVQVPPPA